jgi:hypothetical protein
MINRFHASIPLESDYVKSTQNMQHPVYFTDQIKKVADRASVRNERARFSD